MILHKGEAGAADGSQPPPYLAPPSRRRVGWAAELVGRPPCSPPTVVEALVLQQRVKILLGEGGRADDKAAQRLIVCRKGVRVGGGWRVGGLVGVTPMRRVRRATSRCAAYNTRPRRESSSCAGTLSGTAAIGACPPSTAATSSLEPGMQRAARLTLGLSDLHPFLRLRGRPHAARFRPAEHACTFQGGPPCGAAAPVAGRRRGAGAWLGGGGGAGAFGGPFIRPFIGCSACLGGQGAVQDCLHLDVTAVQRVLRLGVLMMHLVRLLLVCRVKRLSNRHVSVEPGRMRGPQQ